MQFDRGFHIGTYVSLLAIPLVIAVGQILFKQASRTQGLIATHPLLNMASNPYLICAFVIYGIATFWWVIVLRTTTLSHAYAFMALSFLYVPIMSWLVLGERFGWRTVFAFALILAGIVLAATDAPRATTSAVARNTSN